MTNVTDKIPDNPIYEEEFLVTDNQAIISLDKQTDTSIGDDTQSDDHDIQWHPAFVAAMKLEFAAYADQLYFESEHNLNQKPIVADLLLIKKDNLQFIDNDIGRLLRKDNLFEYKGVDNSLDMKSFTKAVAYVYLYASPSTAIRPISINELSLTLVRYAKPIKLLKELNASGVKVKSAANGIYQIEQFGLLPVQLLILREIGFENHLWLSSLTKTLNEHQLQQLIQMGKASKTDYEKQCIGAVLNVAFRANQQIFDKLKGGDPMAHEFVREFFKDEITAMENEKDAIIAEKDAVIADKDAIIAVLQKQIEELQTLTRSSASTI